ncbi:MAG TPA: hypothetical protein VD789_06150 [Thermomicrobiales bacterium]|nr:hypothetical protein [Thermomicrobiales bacterium]
MTTAYSPLHFMEALAWERRRHWNAPAGEGAAPARGTALQRLGRTLARLTRRLRGATIPRATTA